MKRSSTGPLARGPLARGPLSGGLRSAMPWSAGAWAASAVLTLGGASAASAQDQRLASLDAMHAACRASEAGVHDELYSIVLDGPSHLEATEGDEEGETVFTVSDARSFRALGGSVQIVPAHLEPIGFVANGERASALQVAEARGARVRLGFFLGFDEPERRACLVRPAQSVTAVRADVAFVELLDADGSVIAREDNDRLRAWNDDPDRAATDSPEVRVDAPSSSSGAVPEAWSRALRAAPVSRALLACHRAGVARGASPEAMVQVRLRVDARTGRADDVTIEVGNVGDDEESACLARAVRGAELGAIGGEARVIELRVPVHLRAPADPVAAEAPAARDRRTPRAPAPPGAAAASPPSP